MLVTRIIFEKKFRPMVVTSQAREFELLLGAWLFLLYFRSWSVLNQVPQGDSFLVIQRKLKNGAAVLLESK